MSAEREMGFTLAELLVAMLFGIIVLAGVYSYYVTSGRAYSIEDQLLETQGNVRAGLELLVEDIQKAGGTGIAVEAAVSVTNSSTGADSLTLMMPDSTICPSTPQPISIQTYNGAAATMFLAPGTACANMDKKVGMVVTADGTNYRTIQITQVTIANDKVNFSPGLSDKNSPGGLGADYTNGTLVLVREATYAVDIADPSKPVLTRNLNEGAGAQPIANNIEDMQVSLGYDRDSNGILTQVGSVVNDDELVFNFAGESNTGESAANLREVKIIVAGRTKLPDLQFQGSRPAIMDRAAGATDGYRRRVKGTRVKIRNLGPL